MSGAAGAPFGANAGSFFDASNETLKADIATAAALVPKAVALWQASNGQAGRFIAEHGVQVTGGHAQVGIEPPTIGGEHTSEFM